MAAELTPFPPITGQDIQNYCFSSWYAKYHRLSPRARIIRPLPEEFLTFLKSDGILIPGTDTTSLISEIEEIDAETEVNEDSEVNEKEDPLADFTALLTREIALLNGSVVPKLNWSTPKDALWITPTNTLKCQTPQDIYLLLKSSDFISHDLYHAYDDCLLPHPPITFELVLKEWYDLLPSMEFRCFVRNRHLLCLSQRQNHYYPFLTPLRMEIVRHATTLFNQIKDFESENWVFDMYIPRTRLRGHLIDMNPFAPRTDPGLFEWNEILGMRDGEVEVRFVEENERRIGGLEFSAQRVPREVVDVSQGRGVVEFAVEWEEMLRKGVQNDVESDSE